MFESEKKLAATLHALEASKKSTKEVVESMDRAHESLKTLVADKDLLIESQNNIIEGLKNKNDTANDYCWPEQSDKTSQ